MNQSYEDSSVIQEFTIKKSHFLCLEGNYFFLLCLCTFQDPEDISYDVKYALRLCAEFGHKRACVHIYSLMGLYEEAVDMALQVRHMFLSTFIPYS